MHAFRHALRLLVLGALLACSMGAAHAESVLLRSGKRLQADKVEVVDQGVRATLSVTGGTARVTYRFNRLDPVALVDLLERHLLHGDDEATIAASNLRIAKIAFDLGLLPEAGRHFAQAAALDPSLAAERDEGIGKIRDLEAGFALEDVERLLRAGDNLGVLAEVDAIHQSPLGPALVESEALRLATFEKMARALVDKAEKMVAAKAAELEGVGAPADVSGLDEPTRAVLDAVDGAWAKAMAAREAAIDPDVPNRDARRHLEVAGRALLDARRALNTLEPPIAPFMGAVADDVRSLLVTTYLDVADLFREAYDFDAARRWLRAASVLDPENPRAMEIRGRIDDEIQRERLEAPPWYGPAEFYTLYPGGIAPCRYRCHYPRYAAPYSGIGFGVRYRAGHFHGGLRFRGR